MIYFFSAAPCDHFRGKGCLRVADLLALAKCSDCTISFIQLLCEGAGTKICKVFCKKQPRLINEGGFVNSSVGYN